MGGKKTIDERIIKKISDNVNDKDIKNSLINCGYNQADESSMLEETSMGYI